MRTEFGDLFDDLELPKETRDEILMLGNEMVSLVQKRDYTNATLKNYPDLPYTVLCE